MIQGVGTSQTFFSPPNCGTVFGGDWTNLCYQKNGFHIQITPDAICESTGDTALFVTTNNIYFEKQPQVYPNPTEANVEVNFHQNITGNFMISSIDGKALLTRQFQQMKILNIDFSSLENGIYILYLQSSDGKISFHKIVKM